MLRIENATAGYTAVHVLHGVSMHADAGEVVAVLGANGAGKTTLLRLISGLLPLQTGEVTLDGEAIQHLPAQQVARRGVVQVIEARGVLPSLTIEENIVLGLLGTRRVKRDQRRAAIDQAVSFFPWIAERLRSYGGQLSGGEQQMVAISRALAVGPRVLLLDEPSLGIAPTLVDEIYEKIELIAQEDRTVVIVEQHVNKVLAVANRAYVLRRGTVILEGTADELTANNQLEGAYFS